MLTAGTRIGAYEILSLLGAGGMGEVYRAKDTRLTREVAIKVLADGVIADPDRIARFEQEAHATAALSHPNIVALFDVGSHNGRPFIVSELLEGQSLRDGLRQGPLPVRKALEYAVQIATGLAAAHDKGVVHRDLKPDNVFITRDGLPKILDFGIAKLIAPLTETDSVATAAPRTGAGVVLGTTGYMAPEQIRGGTIDARTDVFALGTMLFEMLSGTRPFAGATHADTMTAVLTRDPPDLVLPDGHTPAAVERIVRRCLEKSPDQRFQSARDLSFALEAITVGTRNADHLREGSGGQQGPRYREGEARAARRPFSARELVAWALVLVAVPLAAFLAWQSSRESPPAAQPVGRFRLEMPYETNATGGFSTAIAPDGQALVATGISRDRRLQVRRLDDQTLRSLPGTEGARAPFWSPDSRSVAFVTLDTIYRVNLDGGQPVVLARLPPRANAGFGAWSTKGVILINLGANPLHRIIPETNGLEPVAPLDTANHEIGQAAPVFTPDGTHYFFISVRETGFVTHFASLDGAAPVALPAFSGRIIWAGRDHIVFRRGGSLFAQAIAYAPFALQGEPIQLAADVIEPALVSSTAVSVANAGIVVYRPFDDVRHQFTWIDRAGRRVGNVGAPGNYQGFDLSNDGSRLVVARRDPGVQNLWVVETARSTVTRVTLDDAIDVDPRFAPDGQSVIFGSTRDPVRSPFRATLAGDPPARVFSFRGRAFSLDDWSADGRWLLYHDATSSSLQARRLDQLSADPLTVARAITGSIDQAQMSPDGRFVAYQSNESGQLEVYVVPFPPTGEKWQVSPTSGAQPTWRRDTGELYYLALDGTMMAARLRPGPTFAIERPVALFKTGTGTANTDIEEYAPAPDGSKFLFREYVGEPRLRLSVMTNWMGLLKK